jgi:hypothetical protein
MWSLPVTFTGLVLAVMGGGSGYKLASSQQARHQLQPFNRLAALKKICWSFRLCMMKS